MLELKIMRGLPASGKTTLARTWVAEETARRARINRDELRDTFHAGVYLGHDTERQIVKAEDSAIAALLQAGISVVVDDTNLPQSRVRDLAKIARAHGAYPNAWDLTDVPIELCLERDRARIREGKRGVGDDVIVKMHERFLKGRSVPLPQPTENEVFEEAWTYTPDTSLPAAWIVDIDGTLALKGERGPFEWARVGEDTCNHPVLALVKALHFADATIILMSGRDKVCAPETMKWLDDHGVPWDALCMRTERDTRKDAIVKLELFKNDIAGRYNVVGVIDDRKQVVDMWRSIGLTCAQVAPGDF